MTRASAIVKIGELEEGYWATREASDVGDLGLVSVLTAELAPQAWEGLEDGQVSEAWATLD